MKVFVTGANGFIGKAVVAELLRNGHHVIGLARNETTSQAFKDAGIEPHSGDLTDLKALASGAASADGVIHLAYMHDFSQFEKAAEVDRNAIQAMGDAMIGTNKPLVIASGIVLLPPDELATEETKPNRDHPFAIRLLAADIVYELSTKGVRGSVVRLSPTVHGIGDQGFMTMIGGMGKKNGAITIIGDGSARWPAVHRLDAAVLFRLALEKGIAGSTYHAVGEQGLAWKDIGKVLSEKLNVPVQSKTVEDAQDAIGFFAMMVGTDNPASSEKTQQELGWKPKQVGLLEDLKENYPF